MTVLWLPVAEAAKIVGVDTALLRRAIRAGQLPAIQLPKPPGDYRISQVALDQWWKDRDYVHGARSGRRPQGINRTVPH